MTSSSDRVLRRTPVSERHYRVGEAARGAPDPIDPRPHSVREAEQQFSGEISKMRDQHQAALEEAYQNGYNDGAAMAKASANEQAKRFHEWIESLASEFVKTRADWFAENELQVVELVCAALEQILGDRPPVKRRVQEALMKAFEQLSGGDRLSVRCNPADLRFIEETFKERLDEFSGFNRIKVIADEQIGVGGCLVETQLGVVDARIEKQLAILRGALNEHARARRDNAAAPEQATTNEISQS